jgi:hypothetical protein
MNRKFWPIFISGILFLAYSMPSANSAPNLIAGCVVGQTGPGGGTIFYDAGVRQKWGQCLEAAPVRWSGVVEDPKVPWCNVFKVFFTAAIASRSYLGVAIGKGRANTNLLMVSGCSSGAGVLAHSYHGGGKNDWFLPSIIELHEMYLNRNVIGGFGAGTYWSSTENDAKGAWVHYFQTNRQYLRFKGIPNSVRPIRAF